MAAGRRAARRAEESRKNLIARYGAAQTPGDRLAASVDYLRSAVSPPHPVQGHVDELANDLARRVKAAGDEVYALRKQYATTRRAAS